MFGGFLSWLQLITHDSMHVQICVTMNAAGKSAKNKKTALAITDFEQQM